MNHTSPSKATRWILAGLAALACSATLAGTNPHYRNSPLQADIHRNCDNFSIASDGTLTADCNAVAAPNTRGGTVSYETRRKTIDLDDHLGNRRARKELYFGGSDFSGDCNDLAVAVHANGVKLSGSCRYIDEATGLRGGATPTSTPKSIELNAGIQCDTANGNLIGR